MTTPTEEQIVALPELPHSCIKHDECGAMFDSFQMHQYAMKYADAVLAQQKSAPTKEQTK